MFNICICVFCVLSDVISYIYFGLIIYSECKIKIKKCLNILDIDS